MKRVLHKYVGHLAVLPDVDNFDDYVVLPEDVIPTQENDVLKKWQNVPLKKRPRYAYCDVDDGNE